jgi:PAS domain S-box-containing protein
MQSADAALHELKVHQIELEMQNETLREAQVALEESRDRYLDLFEFAPVGYITLNTTGLIEEINLTGAKLLGQDRKNLRHDRFARFVVTEDRNQWQRFFIAMLQQEGKQSCEVRLLRKDGTLCTVIVECRRRTAGGIAPFLNIALTDISALRRTMDQLRVREDRLRLAQAATGLGIFDHDLVTGKHYVDEHLRKLWGFEPDVPVTYAQVIAGIHPDDRAATEAIIKQALDPCGCGAYAATYRLVSRADGSVHHVAVTGQVFFKDGQPSRFVGAVKDISAQILLQKEIQARRGGLDHLVKQQVASQTVSAIAHELNQPLVAISAYSEAALQMLQKGVQQPQKLVRALEGAMEQAQRAGRTLHELFNFLHEGVVVTAAVNLSGIISDAAATAAESGYGDFRLVLELERDLPPVQANMLQVQKVLINLLHNGIEAMRMAGLPQDAITITVRSMAANNMAQVTVQDCGPGLDNEIAKRIFDPFFTTKIGGIGLGLAISRALVEANGGKLWADHKVEPGATFHFTLPFAL